MKDYSYGTEMDDGKTSSFNSAMFKMRRLDKQQSLLNEINVNLLSFNDLYGVYNYELKFRFCEQLHQEVESKLAEEERTNAEKLRVAIKKFMEKNNVFKSIRNEVNRSASKLKINHAVWNILQEWLYKYETLMRSLMDEHGMDTKYEEYEDGL